MGRRWTCRGPIELRTDHDMIRLGNAPDEVANERDVHNVFRFDHRRV
jgi:hypothetical protein